MFSIIATLYPVIFTFFYLKEKTPPPCFRIKISIWWYFPEIHLLEASGNSSFGGRKTSEMMGEIFLNVICTWIVECAQDGRITGHEGPSSSASPSNNAWLIACIFPSHFLNGERAECMACYFTSFSHSTQVKWAGHSLSAWPKVTLRTGVRIEHCASRPIGILTAQQTWKF